MKLKNKVYDILKWITLILMPALITLVGVILNCYDIKNADTILTILTAIETFMGSVLGISNVNYYRNGDG